MVSIWILGVDGIRSTVCTINDGVIANSAYGCYGTRAAPTDREALIPGFTGDRVDPVLTAIHLGNGYRAFSPVLMRFKCPDSQSPFGEGGINPYAYCRDDPLNAVDPSGHMFGRRLIFAERLAQRATEREELIRAEADVEEETLRAADSQRLLDGTTSAAQTSDRVPGQLENNPVRSLGRHAAQSSAVPDSAVPYLDVRNRPQSFVDPNRPGGPFRNAENAAASRLDGRGGGSRPRFHMTMERTLIPRGGIVYLKDVQAGGHVKNIRIRAHEIKHASIEQANAFFAQEGLTASQRTEVIEKFWKKSIRQAHERASTMDVGSPSVSEANRVGENVGPNGADAPPSFDSLFPSTNVDYVGHIFNESDV